jgi:hypothetical protein
LQVEIYAACPDDRGRDYQLEDVLAPSNLSALPKLRRVRILVFPFSETIWDKQALDQYEVKCRLHFADRICAGGYKLVFELMDMTHHAFEKR